MTSIEWTDESWNPLRAMRGAETVRRGWACVRVSQGCVNCYAATINKRLGTGLDYTVPALAAVETYLDEAAYRKPFGWKKPRRVFVCSMTDLFGEWVTDEQLRRVFLAMAANFRHTFQVLTKRPERMRAWLTESGIREALGEVYGWPLPNVWVGTSIENQATAEERIPQLIGTPGAIRFLSCEPMLGPVELNPILIGPAIRGDALGGIDWLIIGGESGPRARGFNVDWAQALIDERFYHGATIFVKQLGSAPYEQGDEDDEPEYRRPMKLRESHGRDMAEWPEELRVREWPVSGLLKTTVTQASEHE